MFSFIPIAFASFMALMDALVMSWLKKVNLGVYTSAWILPFAMLVYAFQPMVFLKSLQYESMTIMNILWDMISDFSVTAMGLFYFREKLTHLKLAGLVFAFIAIILLSYEE
jgi:multidrug transporter EmrE-like cation transporter|uniref:EamA domain-containing protein n=1 Tax=viral metagenome TaxID=1070528 RepID=A0A6C0IKD5_9ZZZZ